MNTSLILTTTEIDTKMHDKVLKDRRMKLSEVSDVDISNERLANILIQDLCTYEHSTSKLFRLDQERIRMQFLQNLMET